MNTMKHKKKDFSSCAQNSVVLLERLPLWISEQRTVKVFTKSQELVLTSLPYSTPNEYRSMNNPCRNNFLNVSNQDVESDKRLTRSTGGKLDVDFNAKLPDDRNYKCNILGPCYDSFLGFESCHHAIYLSNNEVFQFLSKVVDKMDIVLSMVVTDLDCDIKDLEESPSTEKKHKPTISRVRSNLVKWKKQHNRKKIGGHSTRFRPKNSGQVALQSNDGNSQLQVEKSNCGKDFCRLGCMCESLKAKRKRMHCGHVDCMFSKKCCIGPNSIANDSSRLTLLGQTTNSSDNQRLSSKRTRRPPKRWLEEEEEFEYMAEMKKKSKFFVHASPPSVNRGKGNEGGNELVATTNLEVAKERCWEHNLMNYPCFQNESTSLLKRPCNMAVKSTSGKRIFVSVLKKNAQMETSVTANPLSCSLPGERTFIDSDSSPVLHDNSSLNGSHKFHLLGETSVQAVIIKQYFKNYKEYRKVLMSEEVTERDLESMCCASLSPLQINSIRFMKWFQLEEKVKRCSAFLWLSQAPKCVAKMYVSESEIPPDANSTNLKYVQNFCNIPSSIDYLFQLYKKEPDRFGCCILSCQGFHWEVKGNLNMKTKVGDKIHFKVMRSVAKGSKELTFANSGKKILICQTAASKSEDAPSRNYVPDEVIEAEITEIPEPDIHMYDPSHAHSMEKLGSYASTDHMYASLDGKGTEVVHQEEVCTNIVEPTSSSLSAKHAAGSLLELNWFCLNLDRSFDKLIIDKPSFSALYSQLVYALKISKARNVAVKISCSGGSSYTYKDQIWSQGVYADYAISDVTVKVGPYYSYEVPEIMAFVKVNEVLCRTYVQLTKEPFNDETLPRVTAKEKAALNRVNNSSSLCDAKPKADKIGEEKVRTAAPWSVPSSVSGDLAVASTSSNISDPSGLPSMTTESETSENDFSQQVSEPNNVSQPDFSIKIESVLGNWSGFDDIVNPVSGGKEVKKDSKTAKNTPDPGMKCAEDIKYGYLISEIPNLKAIAVAKGGRLPQDSNSIKIIDPSWDIKDKCLIFRSVEATCAYLHSITKVKLYPDNLIIRWSFVEDKKYLRMNKNKKCFELRNLTENQFITTKGVFSYDDVCTDNLAQYGLKRVDMRRLLEFRRRREIRDAKIELINLLPEPKTGVLVKVIHRSRSLIRSLEEKGKALYKRLLLEGSRQDFLMAELRLKCSGEEMFQIIEKLENIPRTRMDDDLEYNTVYQKLAPRKRRHRIPRKLLTHKKGTSGAASVKATVEPPKLCSSTSLVPAALSDKTIQVLQNKGEEAAVSPSNVIKSPLREYKIIVPYVKSNKEPSRARNLFSGRYVSAATKRSLRKYNYIIPCLARKNYYNLNKTKNDSPKADISVTAEHKKIPLFSTLKTTADRDKEGTGQNLLERISVSKGSFEEQNQVQDAEISTDVLTHDFTIKIEEKEESDGIQVCETKYIIAEKHILGNSDLHHGHDTCAIGLEPENGMNRNDAKEINQFALEEYIDLSSVESFIDVESNDDVLQMSESTNLIL